MFDDRVIVGSSAQVSRVKFFLLIAVAVGVVYAQALRFDFVTYDDYELVVENGEFLSHLPNIGTSFTTHVFTTHRTESGYYRPLLLISYIIEYNVWGLAPSGYHLTNILLHCCTAILIFLLLEKLTKERVGAVIGSLLFALHPVQTEAVAWVAGRNDVLLGLFVAIMMLSYVHHRDGAEGGKKSLALSIVAFGLALFTKESAVFFLLLLPLYEVCFRGAAARSLFSKEHRAAFSLYLLVLMAYLAARQNVIGEIVGAEKLYGVSPVAERLLKAPAIVAEHCMLTLLPVTLSIVHPVDGLIWMNVPWSIGAIAIVILLIAVPWYLFKKDRLLCFGLAWFSLGLVPLLGIIPVAVSILEHRLYAPIMGVAIIAARVCSIPGGTVARKRIVEAAAGIVLLTLAALSFLRLPVWKDSEALWIDAIRKAPGESRSYFNLAGYYFEHQQFDKTIELLRRYIGLKPDDFIGYSKLRQTYYLAGRYGDAAAVNREIIRRNPENPARYLEAGMMFEQLQQFDSAAVLYAEGLNVDSNAFELHLQLGLVYRQTRNSTLAERHLVHALKIKPQDSRALFALGTLYASNNEYAPAIELIERGMTAGAAPMEVVRLLRQLYLSTGHENEARKLEKQYDF
ncbi:MAG TPA: tetratricopeptide repeat protein [Bacteroidota bacterium]|jgi:tetratricopeptide (TPR) repeat protein|nr:tetratricopeptide repeat protein [Bacteroidota bacterium]